MATPIPRREPARVTPCPYPGLRPFEEEDACHFFGRDQEIDDLLTLLARRRFVTVTGVSGCGKSSLVRAGLVPVLKLGLADGFPEGQWRIATLRPRGGLLAGLQRALGTSVPFSGAGDLAQYAQAALADERLLVIVDQFEEIFDFRRESMPVDGGNEAALFVNLLLHAASRRNSGVYVILTMRSDFLGECAQFRGLPEEMNNSHYLVPRLTRLQQEQAIIGPARDAGTSFAHELVQRLLNDSEEDPDRLPVLQHLLKRLWEQKGDAGPIEMSHYRAAGSWAKAIEQDAEAAFATLNSDEQEAARQMFQWITAAGPTGERAIRRARPLAEVARVINLPEENLRELVERFVERDLLRHGAWVDLMHESVIWNWPRLREWVRTETHQASRIHFLNESAASRVALTGSILSEGETVRHRLRASPAWSERYLRPAETALLDEWIARCAAQRERKRVTRYAVVVTVLALALVYAWTMMRQNREAQSRELAAWAALSLTEDPERSLILALHAATAQSPIPAPLLRTLHDAWLASRTRATLRGHHSGSTYGAYAPDGRSLATASWDGTARVWDLQRGAVRQILTGHQQPVQAVLYTPDGASLITGGDDLTVRIWDAAFGRERMKLPQSSAVRSLALAPGGRVLAIGGGDNSIRLWDLVENREIRLLQGHSDSVMALVFTADGRALVSGASDGTTRVWDLSSGRQVRQFTSADPVFAVTLSPNGETVAVGTSTGDLRVLDLRTGDLRQRFYGHRDSIRSVAFAPNGRFLLSSSSDATARVWDIATGFELLVLRGHVNGVRHAAFSPDGRSIATQGEDATTRIWDALMDRDLHTFHGHTKGVRGVTFAPDGLAVITGGDDARIRRWDAASGSAQGEGQTSQGAVRALAVSPNGRHMASTSNSRLFHLWDLPGHALAHTITNQRAIEAVAFSPNGQQVATGSSDQTAALWEVASGRRLATFTGHTKVVRQVAFSPDGRLLATASDDGTARVWDIATRKVAAVLRGHTGPVYGIAFSPDGHWVATAGDDSTARVWLAESGQPVVTYTGHSRRVWGVAFSPDGLRLATASHDNTARLWDAASGQELMVLRGHSSYVWNVAFSPDGTRLATAGEDHVAKLWETPTPETLLRSIRQRITRDLTNAECARYFANRECPALPAVP